MSWTAQISGLTGLAPELEALARLGVHDGMETLGIEGARMVQDNIASPFDGKPAAVATGDLFASVNSQVFEEQALTRLVIGTGTGNKVDEYAPSVETGARPHRPPVDALIPWVMLKLGAKDEKSATRIAWAISSKIAASGTTGHEMFTRAMIDLEPLAVPVLEAAIGARLLAAGGAA